MRFEVVERIWGKAVASFATRAEAEAFGEKTQPGYPFGWYVRATR